MKIITYISEYYTKRDMLKKMQVDIDNWLVYYLDEKTGEKWVSEYLFSERQGGGPPQLRQIEKFPWE